MSINFPELGFTLIPRAMIPVVGAKRGTDFPRLSDDGLSLESDNGKGRQWEIRIRTEWHLLKPNTTVIP